MCRVGWVLAEAWGSLKAVAWAGAAWGTPEELWAATLSGICGIFKCLPGPAMWLHLHWGLEAAVLV